MDSITWLHRDGSLVLTSQSTLSKLIVTTLRLLAPRALLYMEVHNGLPLLQATELLADQLHLREGEMQEVPSMCEALWVSWERKA